MDERRYVGRTNTERVDAQRGISAAGWAQVRRHDPSAPENDLTGSHRRLRVPSVIQWGVSPACQCQLPVGPTQMQTKPATSPGAPSSAPPAGHPEMPAPGRCAPRPFRGGGPCLALSGILVSRNAARIFKCSSASLSEVVCARRRYRSRETGGASAILRRPCCIAMFWEVSSLVNRISRSRPLVIHRPPATAHRPSFS